MADYLYVCEFSNGTVKVGRSLNPENRIAQHVARVECVGVELTRQHIAQCSDSTIGREAALIAKCAAACEKRIACEWFLGISFDDAKGWADECATGEVQRARDWTALFDRQGFQRSFCKEHDISPQTVNNWRRRGVPVEYCARMETSCNREFTRRDFRPDDWHLIWPEMADAFPEA